jgi:hypothetical protein
MLTITLSPDGAITSRDRSNLGSFSLRKLLINLESWIGICSTNVEILTLSVDPPNSRIFFISRVVITGAFLSEGYELIILSISNLSPIVKCLILTFCFDIGNSTSYAPSSPGLTFGLIIFNSLKSKV